MLRTKLLRCRRTDARKVLVGNAENIGSGLSDRALLTDMQSFATYE